ncbi:MAG: HD domain-containing protein, partial [Actinobacteria bacterium]
MTIDPSWFVRPDGSNGATGIHGTGHVRRVGIHAAAIAEALDFSQLECEALRFAALWHDIGR